ncbi:hypothetical protein AB1Y20_013808 [Prymnesium parvum]|uniref:Uncharacterized protein n=1 Tax=Prymnesium parvum TaxID=97485 RepID=A0AB34IE10_PRYPA
MCGLLCIVRPELPTSDHDSEVTSIFIPPSNVKGLRLQVKAEYFGTEWAASDDCQQSTFIGVASSWKKRGDILMVMWEGWAVNRQCALESLEVDADGEPLDLRCCRTRTGGILLQKNTFSTWANTNGAQHHAQGQVVR